MTMREQVVAKVEELQDGEMKQVSVGETEVLLARVGDAFHAVYAYCTHYGAPLADGALSGDRVVCPWHHACFHLPSGDQLEPPGLDSLPRFDVRVEGDEVIVAVPGEVEPTRQRTLARRAADGDDRCFVVLGAGAAGAYAAEAIRQAGFEGRVVMISREVELPYDRPNLSKEYLQGEAPEEWMFLRDPSFYADHDIELMLGRAVAAVDTQAKTVRFEEGGTLAFDGIVICTGGTPRALDVPGAALPGVYTLRSYRDGKALHEAAEAADRVVVVGASFIGMEVAFSLRKLGLDVTVVAPEAVPFTSILGADVGRRLQQVHEDHGVSFKLGRRVQAVEGDGRVERVVLDDGTAIDTDLVVVGIGVVPAASFVEGVSHAEDGSILVDEHLRAADGVYVAGDIARFPDWRTGEPIRIEHWRLACQHGRLAGRNLVGEAVPYRSVPYFWTAHFGTNLRYVGHASGWDRIVFDGDPSDGPFIAYFVEGNRVLAAAGIKRDRELAAFEELMRRDLLPSAAALAAGDVDLVAALRQA